MKEYDDYSAKEKKQLAVCQRLITEKSYLSQEEIRRDLQNHGFDSISQSVNRFTTTEIAGSHKN